MDRICGSKLRLETGIRVRSDLRAGRSVCYEYIDGAWYPIYDPNNPITPIPPLPNPVPPPTPGVQWLDCKSCTGTQNSDGTLSNVTCEVCYL
jgi:hypothetical protein